MRYIANKQDEEEFEMVHIKEMESFKSGMVEVVIGKNTIFRTKLESKINEYVEETKLMNETREEQLEDMRKMLEAMNVAK